MVRNITKRYLCMGPTNIKHFDPIFAPFEHENGRIVAIMAVLESKFTSHEENSGKA